jgi:photosystem II stability/assembly factor-like uncharacterized protein
VIFFHFNGNGSCPFELLLSINNYQNKVPLFDDGGTFFYQTINHGAYMKKVHLLIIFVLAFSFTAFSQWVTQTTGTTGRVLGIKALSATTAWACGQNGVILKTSNGGTNWVLKTAPDPARHNYGIEAFDTTTAWVVSCDGTVDFKIWKTTDGGKTWAQKYSSPTNFSDAIKFFDANTGIAWADPNPSTSGRWEIMRTTDGGETWTRVDNKNIPDADSVNGEFGAATAMDVVGNSAWFVGYSGAAGSKERVYRTTDKGLTWSFSSFDMVGGKSTSGYLAFSTALRGVLVSIDGTIAKTTDGGVTWKTSTLSGGILRAISSVPGVTDMYVAVGGGTTAAQTYVTYDAGDTWAPYTTTAEYLRSVDVAGGMAFAGGNAGSIIKWTGPSLPVELKSFTASQNGKSVNLIWTTATETNNRGFEIERRLSAANFATVYVAVAFKNGAGTSSESHSYSFTDDNISDFKAEQATYRLKQIDFDGNYNYSKEVVVNLSAPLEFSLNQNYPNPFNPTTSIKYSVAKTGLVTLKVYNAMGQEVASLVNEAKEAGSYEVTFNASNLSSGVYFYELNAGDFTSVKKMMLIK